jgi:hypothetical protein
MNKQELQCLNLSEILDMVGIDSEFQDAFVEFADWEYSDGVHVLLHASKVKGRLKDFVFSEFSEITDPEGEPIDDTVVRKNIDELLHKDNVPSFSLIDIAS